MFVPPPESLAERYRIEAAVGLLLDYPQVDRAGMERMLAALDYSPEVARDLCLYLPMAYMRLLLQPVGVRFPDICVLVDRNGATYVTVLRDQTVYEAAVEYATAHLARGMPRQHLKGLLMRSAEFPAVNGQLLEGTAPTNVALEPVLISMDADDATPLDGETTLWSGW